MNELAAMTFAPLLKDRTCDACRQSPGSPECSRPFAVGENGRPTRYDDPTAVQKWPACPGSYMAVRRFGQGFATLPQLVDWAAECGVHTTGKLGAGGERLIMERLRIREAPDVLKRRLEKLQNGGSP